MPTDRTRRLLAAATATATTAGLLLAGAGGTATAQPTTTRGVWVDLPDDAIVVGADAGPSRSTLAGSTSCPTPSTPGSGRRGC